MELRLLGSVEVWAGGRIDLGPPRQRMVLAALAADVGRLVTVDMLIDRVWGEHAPARARRTLHSYVARVRRSMGSAQLTENPLGVVISRSGGYMLALSADEVDIHRFVRLTEAASALADTAERAKLLGRALMLWRGEPLADLGGEWVERMRRLWRHRRLDVILKWAEAEVGSGGAATVVGPLGDLAAQHPLMESLAAMLIRALAAAGRTVDALAAYADIRSRLADELGVDPGAELQSAQLAALQGGGERPATGCASRLVPDTHVIPSQLPAAVVGFSGRRAELAVLDSRTQREQSPACPMIVLSGMAGTGKTTLAVHWAHRMSERFPDGQIHVNLRGYDPARPPLTPAAAIGQILDAFEVSRQNRPADVDAQTALYRTASAGRRVLLLLDDARDADQVRPLLPGSAGCAVVVTSRTRLDGLVARDGAYPVALGALTLDEATELLAGRLGVDRLAAEPSAVREIVQRCAGLPLALVAVAARAAMNPGFPLAALAAELAPDRRPRSTGTDDMAAEVRTAFACSYRALSWPAARLFRLCSLGVGDDLSLPALASIASIEHDRHNSAVSELVRCNLLSEHRPGRYSSHDLLRRFAAELNEDTAADRTAAMGRLIDHYLHTALAAHAALEPGADRLDAPPPRPGTVIVDIRDETHALRWFGAEHANLMAVIGRTAADRMDTHTWLFAMATYRFLDNDGRWRDWIHTGTLALQVAERLGDRCGQARAHRQLGRAYCQLADHGRAGSHLRRALRLHVQLDDVAGQASTHFVISWMCELQGRYLTALRHSELAAELYRRAEHQIGYARALNALGWTQALLGRYRQAAATCQEALALQQELGDPGQAATWDSLGYIHQRLDEFEHALTDYRQALDLYRGAGDRYNEADVLRHLASAERALGHTVTAHALDQQADAVLASISPNQRSALPAHT
jgi:DNA-binding SARP family transcriptional activator